MNQCPNCKEHGLAELKRDSALTARRCIYCKQLQEITKEMKTQSQKELRS